jgi:hypothetical protein
MAPDAITPTTFDEVAVALPFFSANRSSRIIFSVKISYPFPKIHISFNRLYYLKVSKDWIYTCCRSLSSIISSSRVTFSPKTFLISFWKKLIVIMKQIKIFNMKKLLIMKDLLTKLSLNLWNCSSKVKVTSAEVVVPDEIRTKPSVIAIVNRRAIL